MIDHIGIAVSNYRRSRDFYAKALAPIGYTLVFEPEENVAGFGADGKPDFWIWQDGTSQQPMHAAFQSQTRAPVDAFYDAAIAAGGSDNGRPGVRPEYHPNYYAAFVKDPDGHNVEVVCHRPV